MLDLVIQGSLIVTPEEVGESNIGVQNGTMSMDHGRLVGSTSSGQWMQHKVILEMLTRPVI